MSYFLIFSDQNINSTTIKQFSEAWKCPISTEVPQGFTLAEANLGLLDVGIPIFGTSIFGAQSKKEQLAYKNESQTRFKFYHFKTIVSLNTSTEQLLFC